MNSLGKALLFLLLAHTIVFAPLIFDRSSALLERDIGRDYLMQKKYWAEMVREHQQIPLWNYRLHGGVEFLAQENCAALDPLNAIFLLFSPEHTPEAMDWYFFAHSLLLALAALFFYSQILSSWHLRLGFALSMSLGGSALTTITNMHDFLCMPSIPLCLGFMLRYRRRRDPLDFFGAAFAIALPIYLGDPQIAIVLGAISAALLFCKEAPLISLGKALLLALCSLAASAAQLLPTLELYRRSAEIHPGLEFQWNFEIPRLLDLIFPAYFGGLAPLETFWYNEGFFFIFSHFWGSLITFGLLFCCSRELLQKHKWIVIGAVFFLLASLGPATPLHSLLSQIPLWQAFRYPERLILFFAIAMASLSAIAMEQSQTIRLSKTKILSGLAFLLALGISGIFLPDAQLQTIAPALGSTLTVIAALLAYYHYLYKNFPSSILLFCLLELAISSQRMLWPSPTEITQRPPYISVDAPFARISAHPLGFIVPSQIQKSHPEYSPIDTTLFAQWEAWYGNVPSYFGWNQANGEVRFFPAERARFFTWAEAQPKALLALLGVKYELRRNQYQIPQAELQTDALPYARLLHKWDAVKNQDELLARGLERFYQEGSILESDLLQAKNSTIAAVTIADSNIHRTGSEFAITLMASPLTEDRLLHVNEGFSPHWKAYRQSQGQEQALAVARVNGWSLGAFLPQDVSAEQIIFRYENPAIGWGTLLTLLFLGAWIACYFQKRHFGCSIETRNQ